LPTIDSICLPQPSPGRNLSGDLLLGKVKVLLKLGFAGKFRLTPGAAAGKNAIE
jgi:hypothetical protein